MLLELQAKKWEKYEWKRCFISFCQIADNGLIYEVVACFSATLQLHTKLKITEDFQK